MKKRSEATGESTPTGRVFVIPAGWGWWNISNGRTSSIEDFKYGQCIPAISSFPKKVFEATCLVSLWSIWHWRNRVLHANDSEIEKARNEDIFPSLQRLSAHWFAARLKKAKFDMQRWISSPNSALVDPG